MARMEHPPRVRADVPREEAVMGPILAIQREATFALDVASEAFQDAAAFRADHEHMWAGISMCQGDRYTAKAVRIIRAANPDLWGRGAPGAGQ